MYRLPPSSSRPISNRQVIIKSIPFLFRTISLIFPIVFPLPFSKTFFGYTCRYLSLPILVLGSLSLSIVLIVYHHLTTLSYDTVSSDISFAHPSPLFLSVLPPRSLGYVGPCAAVCTSSSSTSNANVTHEYHVINLESQPLSHESLFAGLVLREFYSSN
ncbi:hypothetical protein BDM02DRAFT_1279676 [Thelephora ganbajun]|uniref:Uncharacterized protein n=1 Tax=Thelephora ganbajun TaxID=370292 RepID=A0ACB6Z3Q0_THEGA|nr:hypothetical protein BDM02DRAFT_1279676 [Thelephora ganbajun]